VFETLSDRLTQVFSTLRGRGRLSAADIDATAREIRIALLEADVALPVVREFIARVKERASSEEVSGALNPAQQVIKIVHDELWWASGPGWRIMPRSQATAWATRSRWRATRSGRLAAASTTSSSSTPPAGWALTRS
jgi:signal recognition particle GTPase